MAPRTLLDLSTDAPERVSIKIDGKAYELRSRDDLGLKEDHEFRTLMPQMGGDGAKDWTKMAAALDAILRIVVLELPDEVLKKLSDAKKLKIVEAFTKEVVASRQTISKTEESAVPA